MKLPNGAQAIIPEGKLEDYCLNPFHPDGKHKAKLFEKALGITQENSIELEKLVLQVAQAGEITKEQENVFGKMYRVEHEVEGLNQKEALCTLWVIHESGDTPFLTSSFIKTKSGTDDTNS